MSKVIVVGGGPAGMFAAIAAAECGHTVTLLEKNEKLGKKLYITGKGRCNLTNAGDMENLFDNVMTNAKFLYSAFYAYDNRRVIDFFEKNGMKTKVERGNRVFPVSDHSSDVIAALQKVLKAKKVEVKLHTCAASVLTEGYAADGNEKYVLQQEQETANYEDTTNSRMEKRAGKPHNDGMHAAWQFSASQKKETNNVRNQLIMSGQNINTKNVCNRDVSAKKKNTGYVRKITGVKLIDGTSLCADAVILATGGFSYQATGSTGDGYRFARELGHSVTEIRPSLVPFYTAEDYVTKMQGLSLKNVNVRIKDGNKILYEEFGEMLFTHFGVSGPLILSASAAIKPKFIKKNLSMEIDLKPALSMEQLDHRLLREFEEAKNKQFKNSIGHLFPSKMIPVMLELSGIDPEKKVNEITKEERKGFVQLIKAFPLTLNGLRDFNEAIITRGGVRVKEINPSTMESKIIKHLYFCGELLDLDAMTGGYNLQIAWSTGYLAGSSIN